MKRVVVLLLVIRVLASPIAASQASSRVESRFVVRVCSWPVPEVERGLVRSPEADSTAPGSAFPVGLARAGRDDGGSASRSRSRLKAGRSAFARPPSRSADRPRC